MDMSLMDVINGQWMALIDMSLMDSINGRVIN
jgi:hypothetical protein